MDFNSFLTSLVSLGGGQVSDLHFKVGSPPLIRVRGNLEKARFNKLRAEDTKKIAQSLVPHVDIDSVMGLDTSYSVPGEARYRVNIFRQRGQISIVLRVIPKEIPTIEDLNLPKILETIALEERGLVLVTGITGSGKSSTLAAIVNHINQKRSVHILTIEDPIEFIYQDLQCPVNQREVMRSTSTIQEYIEVPDKTALIKDAIVAGRSQYGMQVFDQHLRELYEASTITMETAMAAATSPADFERALTFE